jgi:hypothetical protein
MRACGAGRRRAGAIADYPELPSAESNHGRRQWPLRTRLVSLSNLTSRGASYRWDAGSGLRPVLVCSPFEVVGAYARMDSGSPIGLVSPVSRSRLPAASTTVVRSRSIRRRSKSAAALIARTKKKAPQSARFPLWTSSSVLIHPLLCRLSIWLIDTPLSPCLLVPTPSLPRSASDSAVSLAETIRAACHQREPYHLIREIKEAFPHHSG